MIKTIKLSNYKSLNDETLDLKNLTILTGLNSSGKSSVIQAILVLVNYHKPHVLLEEIIKPYKEFESIRNEFNNAELVFLELKSDEEQHIALKLLYNKEPEKIDNLQSNLCSFEENLFYISANRIGSQEIAMMNRTHKFGVNGEFVFSYFEQHKNEFIDKNLIKEEAGNNNLSNQITFWLKYILDIELKIITSLINASIVAIKYTTDDLDSISPLNMGAGNSYVARLVIMGLACKPNNTLIIENPEIHLHPKAQSKLADFFSFLAHKGVQVILETHSEHLINKVRYNIYNTELKKDKCIAELNKDEAIIYYKEDLRKDFKTLYINEDGRFANRDGEEVPFPKGFFDSTLKELMMIRNHI
ncbi:AAA family ATPase [Helicobacter cetorum]|uniref:AAA family ATPase n=1 Tax=Helicobacter cetorum TaxID=138563 RepID=UPI000CF16103|nr:AAA family ATPase [Helicobacter cetorum]